MELAKQGLLIQFASRKPKKSMKESRLMKMVPNYEINILDSEN